MRHRSRLSSTRRRLPSSLFSSLFVSAVSVVCLLCFIGLTSAFPQGPVSSPSPTPRPTSGSTSGSTSSSASGRAGRHSASSGAPLDGPPFISTVGYPCSKSGTCDPGQYCALFRGEECCLSRTCHPACKPDEECVKTTYHRGPLSCLRPEYHVCQKRYTDEPVALPPHLCHPACTEEKICARPIAEKAHRCVKPFPGCWTWEDCTVDVFYVFYSRHAKQAERKKIDGKGGDEDKKPGNKGGKKTDEDASLKKVEFKKAK